MQLTCLLAIMISGAVIGGSIYYISPTNKSENGTPVINWIKSVVFGLGATAIIPVLFVTTQSQLLDNIEMGRCNFCSTDSLTKKQDTLIISIALEKNLTKPKVSDSTAKDTAAKLSTRSDNTDLKKAESERNKSTESKAKPPYNAAAGYLLWLGYSVLAAAAGFGFIRSLMSKVVTAGELNSARVEIKNLKETQVENDRQNLANLLADEQKAQSYIAHMNGKQQEGIISDFIWPVLPPVTNMGDPQKGRFGGQSQKNGRELRAKVETSLFPGFFSVNLSVVTTGGEPLTGYAVFFLHSSFSEIVRIVTAKDGMAKLDTLIAYGAFTVGVATDYGKTLLELDLSDPKLNFPQAFHAK